MSKLILAKWLILALLCSAPCYAQFSHAWILTGTGAPSGNCSPTQIYVNLTNGNIYSGTVSGGVCTWTLSGGGGVSYPGVTGDGLTPGGLNIAGTLKAGTSVIQVTTADGHLDATKLNGAIANGVTATTQSAHDNSTKVATTAYVDAGGGALTLITETLLGTTATNFDFTSIPGTYRDLIVKCDARGDNASGNINVLITFNADTASHYDYYFSESTGASLSTSAVSGFASANISLNQIPAASATANYSGGLEFTVPNYKGTTFYKRGLAQSGLLISASGANAFIATGSFWWRSTSAITEITLTASAGNFIAGSICSLYGRS